MKNRITRLLFYVAVYPPQLLTGAMLASCSMEDMPHGGGTRLPEGEYPVTLSASVEVDTRATADNFWDGGEQVAVEAVSDIDGVQPEVKTYTVTSGGGLTSDEPLWWTNTKERKTLRAWCCGDGSSAAGRDNSSAVPTEWTVQSDQSGNVTLPGGAEVDGYQSSDLLFAPEVVAEFSGSAAVPLKFCHQTAKVVVNIKKAEYVTDASQIKAVRIGDDNLILTAGFTAPADGSSAGVWTTDGAESTGTVTPRKLDVPTKDGYVASYEALIIPQQIAGKRMVAVDTDAGTMYYTAPADAEPLVAGKVHTYNISIDEAISGIEVTGNTWSEGEFVGLATGEDAAAYMISDGRLVPADARNSLWWDSKTFSVVGWYAFGMSKEYAGARPEIFTVQADQSTAEGVRRSDFLYAKGNITYGGSNSLEFKHSLTKLRVNITYKNCEPGSFNWKYPFLIDGVIGEDGTVTADTDGTSSIVRPMKLTEPYGDNDETFEFMLPVQFLEGSAVLADYTPAQGGNAIELELPADGIQLKTGVAMAVDVVISTLQITINGSIGWGEGGSGSGSVEL